jgi:hypothetical protein
VCFYCERASGTCAVQRFSRVIRWVRRLPSVPRAEAQVKSCLLGINVQGVICGSSLRLRWWAVPTLHLESHKRARIVHRSSDFLRAEYASLIFGFVDDVEFWFPADHPVIHIRSASRTGSYDFGVNRRRIERIRAQFEKHAGKHDGLGGGIRSDV